MLGLYMSITGSYLALWVHWGPSLQEKVHVHSYGQLLMNVEYHRKGTVTIGLTVQTENVSHSSSENLLSMTNLSHYWRELTGQYWKNYLWIGHKHNFNLIWKKTHKQVDSLHAYLQLGFFFWVTVSPHSESRDVPSASSFSLLVPFFSPPSGNML